jgi:GT2 family glycosyltransferase
MIKLTASIVTFFNEKSLVENAINSLIDCVNIETIYIVDNSSQDYFSYLKMWNKIKYIHNPSNPGFGASHNIAIKLSIDSGAKYHLVVNPDVYFESEEINKMTSFMDANPDVGHLMPRILYPNGDNQYLCKKNPTFFDLFIRGFIPEKYHTIFGKRILDYQYKTNNPNEILYDVPYLSGCFMFLRNETLKKVGLFDDKIFMYLEDADLTRRILEVSRTVYFPDAIVYHHFARFTHKKIKFKLITIKSAFYYFNKWGWLSHLV